MDTPMRNPVYEPGPQLTATASSGMAWLSANDNASSTNTPNDTACEGPFRSSFLKTFCPSSLTATEQAEVDVSMCKIHDITSILNFIVANLRDLFRLHKLFVGKLGLTFAQRILNECNK